MNSNIIISVTGLGYVGIPLAVAFAKKFKVIGFDINKTRVKELGELYDRTGEVDKSELSQKNLSLTTDAAELKKANFHIVTVPTPVSDDHQPDLGALLSASKTVGKALKKGDTVVYESTVYPGSTEEDCVPLLEEHSGLKCGVDFKVGYSPERINPGDKEHTFTKILKVVSGMDQESLDLIADVYGSVVTAGIYKASTIKVAEAAKVIENTQRDINIAFMNELSLIFKRMNIDTHEVLRAAGTKWNFLKFYPGLVGGHCIGVDPYYLTYKSEKLGYHPDVILAGRKINDSMGKWVAAQAIEMLKQAGYKLNDSRVSLMGLTFKENCPDVRNTRVLDIYEELVRLGVHVDICDPMAHPDEIKEVFGKAGTPIESLEPADAVILAAPHKSLVETLKSKPVQFFKTPRLFVDVKGAFEKSFVADKAEGRYWRL